MRRVALIVSFALTAACAGAPKQTAPVLVTAPAGPVQTTTPLDLSTGRPMVAIAFPGGHSGQFILDTGSQGAVLTQSAADTLKLEIIGEALLGSPAGGAPVKVFVVNLGNLMLAGAPATKTEAVVAADKTLPANAGMGVLAPTQWGDKVVTIDLAANTLTMGTSAPDTLQTWHPISSRNQTEADIEIAGEKLRAHIDTGNPRGVVLPLAMAKTLGVENKLTPTETIRTVDASAPAFTAKVDAQISIGGVKLAVSDVTFSGAGQANIGVKALRGYTLVLDNPRRRWAITGPA
jgi:predicted aspartyl protease